MINKIAYFFIVLLFTCCSNREIISKLPSTSGSVININVEDDRSNKVLLSDFLSNFHYLKLGTNEDFLIGEIEKVVFSSDKVYVLDQNKAKAIFAFDLTGKPLFRVLAIGRGPGEYLKINDFEINPLTNDIWVHDLQQNKIIVFNERGKYIKELRPKFHFFHFSFIDSAHIAFHIYKGRNNFDSADINSLIVTNQNLDIKYRAFPASEELADLNIVLPRAFRKYNNQLTFFPEFSKSIYSVDSSGLNLKYSVNFGKDDVDVSDLNGLNQYEYINRHLTNKWVLFEGEYQETESILYFAGQLGFGREAFVFYSKKSGKIISGRSTHLSNLNHYFWSLPRGSTGKEFFSIINASQVVAIKHEFPTTDKRIEKKLRKILDDTNENDNPILLFYTLKDF